MNTYQLFIKVVELESLTAAAKVMNKTPSAVSKQIQALESKLGVQLLNRTTRSFSITHAGQLYYQRCIEIARHIENTEVELKDLSDTISGQLKVTWPSVLSSSPVIQSLAQLVKTYPGIKLDVIISNQRLDLVQEGFDFAIRIFGSEDIQDSSLIAIKVAEIQTIYCASAELIKDKGMPKCLEEILALPQIIPTYLPLAQALRRFAPEIDALDMRKHHKASELHTVYHLLKSGLGAAFIARHVVERELAEGSLINLTGESLPKLPVYLVYPKLDYQPKLHRCFIDHFKEKFLLNEAE